MAENKRYVVTIEFYMWAKDDETVIAKANEFAKEMDLNTDNRCSVVEIVEQPFATTGNRPVIKQ